MNFKNDTSRMPLVAKLIIYFFLVSLLPLIALSYEAYSTARDNAISEKLSNLSALASIQKMRVETYMNNEKKVLRAFGTRMALKEGILDYLQTGNKKALESIVTKVILSVKNSDPKYLFIAAIDIETGVAFASTDKEMINQDLEEKFNLPKVAKEPVLGAFYKTTNNQTAFTMAMDIPLENGKFFTIVMGELSSGLSEITLDRKGFGETGETILAKKEDDGSALFIVSNRFKPDSALSLKIAKTDAQIPMIKAVNGFEGVVDKATDYRGRKVFAVARNFPEYNWGLVVKFNEDEVLKSVDALNNKLYIVMTVSTIAAIVLSLFFALRFYKPLLRLKTDVENAQGNLEPIDIRNYSSSVEMMSLAEAFNDTFAKISEFNGELDTLVQVRTAELNAQKETAELYLNIAGAMIVALNSKGEIILANNKACLVLGDTKDEIVGQNWFDNFIPYHEIQETKKAFTMIMRGEIESVERFENNIVTRDGKVRMIAWYNTALRDDAGEIIGILSSGEDVTESKKVEEILKEFQTIFNASKDGIAILDMESNFLEFNDTYLEMTGFTHDELLSKSCIGLSVPEDIPRSIKAIEIAIKEGYIKNYEKTCIVKDGKKVTINMSIALMPDKKRLLISTKDITEQRESRLALIQAKEEAESANRAKSDFVANMSHEIRTPMNAVLGLTRLVLESDLSDKQRNYLQKVQDSSEALLNILNDILDYSKIEAGKLGLEEVDFSLEKVLRNVSGLFSVKAEEKDIEIFIDISNEVPNILKGDSLRLSQVLNNLVGNAVKFTQKGEINIKIDSEIDEAGDKKLRICIQDSGIGISDESMKKLFQSFSQADTSTTRNFGGTGLGLAISKQIVNLMGGSIWVESEIGKGSTFCFKIPLISANVIEKLTNCCSLGKMKTLVVDDQNSSLLVMEKILQSWCFDVTLANSGEEALLYSLSALQNNKPYDAYLIDWKMPGMNGIELAKKIENQFLEFNIKRSPLVIMVTAYKKDEVLQVANEVTLDAILEKPVTPSNLMDTLMALQYQYCNFPAEISKDILESSQMISGAKILLVEDNQTNQLVAKGFLDKLNVDVYIAENGLQALKMVTEMDFDLVLMDLQMPVMDGFEATRQIRALSKGKTLPIVAMTAAAMKDDKEMTAKVGMNAHVSKPINFEELTEVLNHWIKIEQINHSVTDTTFNTDEFEAFDHNRLDSFSQLGLGRSVVLNIMKSFKAEHKDAGKLLKTYIENTNFKDALNLIHSIKGASGNIGAKKVYDASVILENELHQKNAESLDIFINHLNKTLIAIENISDTKVDKKQCSLDEALTTVLNIKELLAQNIYITEDKILDLQSCLDGAIEDTLASNFIISIRDMNFDKALKMVDTIENILKRH